VGTTPRGQEEQTHYELHKLCIIKLTI